MLDTLGFSREEMYILTIKINQKLIVRHAVYLISRIVVKYDDFTKVGLYKKYIEHFQIMLKVSRNASSLMVYSRFGCLPRLFDIMKSINGDMLEKKMKYKTVQNIMW